MLRRPSMAKGPSSPVRSRAFSRASGYCIELLFDASHDVWIVLICQVLANALYAESVDLCAASYAPQRVYPAMPPSPSNAPSATSTSVPRASILGPSRAAASNVPASRGRAASPHETETAAPRHRRSTRSEEEAKSPSLYAVRERSVAIRTSSNIRCPDVIRTKSGSRRANSQPSSSANKQRKRLPLPFTVCTSGSCRN